MKLWIEKVHLDLKVNWKLSRNQTTFKENFIVHLETPSGHFRSEVAPNIRYGETVERIQDQFEIWVSTQRIDFQNEKELTQGLDKSPLFHSLRFGLESVFLSAFAHRYGKTLSEYLQLSPPPSVLATSYSMPITPIGEIASYLKPLGRFQSLKIKVDAESGEEMLREIKKHTSAKLRIDANEGWKSLDDFLTFQASLRGMNIELIEQPFPASLHAEYKELKKITPYKLLADESIEDAGDFSLLAQEFHAINIKLMKTGSLLKARDLLLESKRHGLEAMIGCMIETSLGISYGMIFGGMTEYVDLDGFLLIKDEPFSLVIESEGFLRTNL